MSSGFNALANSRRRALQHGNMKSRHQALPVVQGAQGIHTALKPDVEMQIGGVRHVPLQHRQRDVVTCPQREQPMARISRLGEYPRKIRAQGLDVRLHPGPRAPLGPQKPLGKLRGAGALALRPHDERLAEFPLPLM